MTVAYSDSPFVTFFATVGRRGAIPARYRQVVVITAVVITSLFLLRELYVLSHPARENDGLFASSSRAGRRPRPALCEPYATPGRLLLFNDTTHPERTHYETFSTTCFAKGDYLTRIRAREPIPELQDKTLLLLGDSVDRFTVVDFCSQYVGKNASAHPLDSFTGIVSQILPNMGGYSRSCYLDYLNLKVAWSFFYGFDETDMWQDKKSAYTAPGQFSERWRLSLEALKTIPTPNLVMVNAGFWELARFDRLYERAYKSEPDPPTVSTEFLNEYIGLTTQWLADVRKAVGSSPRIRWRQTHYPGKATGSYFTIAGEKKKPRARFHEVKIRALNAAAGVAVQQASEAELRSRISWPEKPGLGELQDDGSITIWPIGDIMSGWDTKLWVRDEIHQTADVGSFVFGESLMEYLARSPR